MFSYIWPVWLVFLHRRQQATQKWKFVVWLYVFLVFLLNASVGVKYHYHPARYDPLQISLFQPFSKKNSYTQLLG